MPWITDITDFLDDDGELICEPPPARKLADYLAAIILMASYPGPECPPEYRVSCRRRPQRKACQEEIAGFVDPETDHILWVCPRCGDRGLISNWRGTVWDLSAVIDIDH